MKFDCTCLPPFRPMISEDEGFPHFHGPSMSDCCCSRRVSLEECLMGLKAPRRAAFRHARAEQVCFTWCYGCFRTPCYPWSL